jgi:hypothetical protein
MRFIYSNKKILTLGLTLFLSASLRAQVNNVQVIKIDNDRISGEFLGTYMDHIHLFVNDKLVYVDCQDLISVKKDGSDFAYDCSKNTIAPEVLFPPKFDPMTGENMQKTPDVFKNRILSKNIKNSVLSKPAQNKTKTTESIYMTRAEVLELIKSEIKDRVKLEIESQLAFKINSQNLKNKKISQTNIMETDPVLGCILAGFVFLVLVNPLGLI